MSKILINNTTYKLDNKNYYEKEFLKQQIVIGNSFSSNMSHVIGWKTRHNGEYKRTAPFSIDIFGNIYQHYDPKYYSKVFDSGEIDKHIILILIENEGWLIKDSIKNEYIDWVGNIYNRKAEIIEKRWRNHTYWPSYTNEQMESALKLVKYLCNMFDIPLRTVNHNTKFMEVYEFRGVLYKSNFETYFTDVNPTWDANVFKNKLELI